MYDANCMSRMPCLLFSIIRRIYSRRKVPVPCLLYPDGGAPHSEMTSSLRPPLSVLASLPLYVCNSLAILEGKLT